MMHEQETIKTLKANGSLKNIAAGYPVPHGGDDYDDTPEEQPLDR